MVLLLRAWRVSDGRLTVTRPTYPAFDEVSMHEIVKKINAEVAKDAKTLFGTQRAENQL
jgi:hypothetical protein